MNNEPLFNIQLNAWSQSVPSPHAGKGHIEEPGKGVNLRWQNRLAEPTAYENALADAVQAAYLEGAQTVSAMADAFNARQFRSKSNFEWTAESLKAEMQRLGH